MVLRTLVLIPLILLRKKRYFRQKIETVSPVGKFSPKQKKTGVNAALCVLVLSWAIVLQRKTHVYNIL
jgi:hypothetical protein